MGFYSPAGWSGPGWSGPGGVGQVEWASDHPVRREHGFLLQDWACAQRVAGLNPVTGRVVMC